MIPPAPVAPDLLQLLPSGALDFQDDALSGLQDAADTLAAVAAALQLQDTRPAAMTAAAAAAAAAAQRAQDEEVRAMPWPAACTAVRMASAYITLTLHDSPHPVTQEVAFETGRRLAAQVAAARAALAHLEALAAELDAAATGLRDEAAAATQEAAGHAEKTRKYETQQAGIAVRLASMGCCPEVRGKSRQCRNA